jgi:hypothetical protein
MYPWELPVPAVLYKYQPPERIDVLTNSQIRFSQRFVFDDQHELQPDYASFGTVEQISRLIRARGIQLTVPNGMTQDELVHLIASEPRYQQQVGTMF